MIDKEYHLSDCLLAEVPGAVALVPRPLGTGRPAPVTGMPVCLCGAKTPSALSQ